MPSHALIVAAGLLVTLASCSGKRRAPPEQEDATVPAPDAPTVAPASSGPELLRPAAGPVAAQVVAAAGKARADGKTLLVYVGAGWCEPCVAFHDAVESGQLDAVFPNLQILEFDQDTDGSRLADDGYVSRLIPLFAIPDRTGKMGAHISGGIKGPRAVDNLVQRLEPLLAKAD